MIPPLTSTGAGDNGLYGGQLQPMAVFLTALAAVISFGVKQADASDFELCACVSKACLIWGLFVRMVALVYFVAFFSLHGQIRGLAGKNGLFPAAEMLQRTRQDFPGRMWRWLHFPAGLLWISCSDSALRGTCVLGMLCAAGAAYGVSSLSPLLLVLCWIILVQLSTVCGASFGYPWDCLLSEIGVFVGVLLPPVAPLLLLSGPRPALADLSSVVSAISLGLATSSTAASNAATPDAAAAAATAVLPSRVLPSRVAVWSLRLLLVRVVLGMGKMKFSSGWNGSDNHLYLKHFMSWQPLPTPLSRWMQTSSRIMTDGLWIAMHYAMWVLEVPLPALFLSGSLAVRSVASVLTIMLQLGIQLTGNYGTFNVLTAALAIPLLAPDCREAYALSGAASAAAATAATTTAGSAPSPISVAYLAGPQLLCALLLNVVGLIHFPHNSYTTNVWPYFPTYELVATMRPAYLRRPVTLLLKLFRALGPWHVAHGYGVFTPRALRGCSHARRSLRIEVSRNGGETWRCSRRASIRAAGRISRSTFSRRTSRGWSIICSTRGSRLTCSSHRRPTRTGVRARCYCRASRRGFLKDLPTCFRCSVSCRWSEGRPQRRRRLSKSSPHSSTAERRTCVSSARGFASRRQRSANKPARCGSTASRPRARWARRASLTTSACLRVPPRLRLTAAHGRAPSPGLP